MSHDPSLEAVLRAVEPAARLVTERHLLKVLHYLIDWGRPLPTNPNLPFWVSRADLAAADVLAEHVMAGTEPTLLLLTEPDDRMVDRLPRAEQLRAYWRALFQAAVMREIDRKRESGGLTTAACREGLNQFGPTAAREIRYVLEAEHLVDPEADNAVRFRTFVAVYLDGAVFGRGHLDDLFPSLPRGEAVSHALAAGLDVPTLLAHSRPVGAAPPEREPDPDERWMAADTIVGPPPAPPRDAGGLPGQAHEAERQGNNVRAAILRTQLAGGPSEENRDKARTGARGALGKLVDALGEMFHWDHETRQEWRQALVPLLEPAAAGVWPRAARCLYELQKITADLSREVYAVELAETIRTFGGRPVKRVLPHAKPVLVLMGFKRAYAQMLRTGLGHAARLRLDRLFHHQIHALEHGIRHEFTPIIVDALDRAGLTPTNAVEGVGRDKLVAELLDRICERGYLRIGDLRDAIARNRLKMADLAGPGDFLGGDALLRADINLAYALDGVYRKGEFYLRWIQRFSGVFFGTTWGRLFTLYLALPFGGAFLTLMAVEELRHIGGNLIAAISKPATATPTQPANASQPDVIEADEVHVEDDGAIWWEDLKPGTIMSDNVGVNDEGDVYWTDPTERAARVKEALTPPTATEAHHKSELVGWPTVLGFGVFLVLMFHAPPFRRAVLTLLGHTWRALRGVLWDVPMGLWRSPAMRGFRQSRAVRFLIRHFWSPLVITALAFGVMFLLGATLWFLIQWGWLIWAALTISYNFLGVGWILQDRVAEAVSDWWRVIRVNLLPGLIGTILDWFRRLGNWVERRLYAVDEWLRFRGGDSQGSLAVKATLGLIWFPIAYVFRFAFNLLVEPQVNPIKHFPVVTVSHKMLLPLVVSKDPAAELSMFGELIAAQTGFGIAKANFWGFWIIAGVPGIFGFMAWEFLANWRLYRANRPGRLRPVMLGSHGETMRGMLRPGFHSGTVPKLFKKLRHADRAKADRLHHELEHSAEGVQRFVDRELIVVLDRAAGWGESRLHIGAVKFGCQQLTIELAAPTLGRDAFTLVFENIGGRIQATVAQIGWADKLTEPQRAAFVVALRGLLDMAAVEVVDGRERSDDAPTGVGLGDLARRVSWDEWVARWDVVAKTPPQPLPATERG